MMAAPTIRTADQRTILYRYARGEDIDQIAPQVEFHHIEVMLSDKEEQAAKKLFDAACKARLGEVPQQTLFEDRADEETDGTGGGGEEAPGQ